MSNTEYQEKITSLFKRWKEARPEYEQNGHCFTEDGIANFDNWEKAKPKILFLLKENHEDGWQPSEPIQLIDKPFNMNIARWRQIIIELFNNHNKELDFESIKLPEIIDDIALVDIKKLNEWKCKSDDKEIYRYAGQDKDFLMEQISLINPNIILCCKTFEALDENIYSTEDWEELISESNCKCYRFENRLVIDFYHPSTRNADREKELFEILVKMLKEGKVFEKLN